MSDEEAGSTENEAGSTQRRHVEEQHRVAVRRRWPPSAEAGWSGDPTSYSLYRKLEAIKKNLSAPSPLNLFPNFAPKSRRHSSATATSPPPSHRPRAHDGTTPSPPHDGTIPSPPHDIGGVSEDARARRHRRCCKDPSAARSLLQGSHRHPSPAGALGGKVASTQHVEQVEDDAWRAEEAGCGVLQFMLPHRAASLHVPGRTLIQVSDDSNEEDDSSSNAFYTDSCDLLSDFDEHDDPVNMDLLKATVEAAKADAKKANMHYAEKSDRKVDESFDRLYCDIRDGVLAPLKK
ncbi:uncharacterized protein [Miscanthus floridulus]|uniref:uncharacterized protein n=1 Tax=Miscanthus floridulus TaxID=154761 RepID=UPI003458C0E8